MQHNLSSAVAIELPAESRIVGFYEATNLADAYAICLPGHATTDPERLARFVFAQQPSWVHGLMTVRDALVAGFGLKTAKQLKSLRTGASDRRVGIFRIYGSTQNEIILGEDDKHLNFRLSVLYQPGAATAGRAPRLVLSTVVQCHNLLGRAYIVLIAPFHRLVVRANLRRAARTGWPRAS